MTNRAIPLVRTTCEMLGIDASNSIIVSSSGDTLCAQQLTKKYIEKMLARMVGNRGKCMQVKPILVGGVEARAMTTSEDDIIFAGAICPKK